MTAVGVVAVGCTTSGTPATAPPTTEATSVATTATEPPPITTMAPEPSTTIDRVAEIAAIFQDLEERRLQALYEGDVEAFTALFANEAYMTRSLGVLDLVEFVGRPTLVDVDVLEIRADGADCIAALVRTDATEALGPQGLSERVIVLERISDSWGFSYVGEGWACEGLHPFSL